MGLKIGDETIDGVRVISQQMPAMKAMTLAARLARIIGPLLNGVRNIRTENFASFLDGDISTLAPIVGEWLGGLDEATFMQVVRELLSNVQAAHEGKLVLLSSDAAIDEVFSAKLGTLIKVVVWSARLNFSSFFEGLPVAKLGASAVAAPSPSPSTSPS